MEKTCLKIPFSILQLAKKAEKAIFWSRIHFFEKFVIFVGKLLSFRILHLAYPKLVGTPCITKTLNSVIWSIFKNDATLLKMIIVITGASLIRSRTSLPLFAPRFSSEDLVQRASFFRQPTLLTRARARLCVLQHLRLGCPPVAYWWGRCFTSIISREFEQFPPWRDKDFI